MTADLQRLLDIIRFDAIVREESKRVIYCEPHRHAQIQAAVDGARANRWLTVRASRFCPEGKLLVVDEQTIEAGMNEAIQRPIRFFGR